MKRPSTLHFHKLLRKYHKVQQRLSESFDVDIMRHLRRKRDILHRRILRLNRRWKIGIASTALIAWLGGPVQGQSFPPSFFFSTLDGSNGFIIQGANDGDYSGRSISGAGDINGDGIDDLIIGAHYASPNNNSEAGASFVVFGSNSPFSATLDLSTLNGSNGFVLEGSQEEEYSGWSVRSAGDINGDGTDDLIIGAPYAELNDSTYTGGAYVVFGRTGGFGASLALSSLDGNTGFVVLGKNDGDYAGTSVSGAGDVNGDGIDDLIIGATGANNEAGESYIIFGSASSFADTLGLQTLNGSNGFAIQGIHEDDYSGASVSNAGDINGDGIDDILIGATYAYAGNTYVGESYIVFGRDTGFGANFALSSLDGSNGFIIQGIGEYGIGYGIRSVSALGDVNGDGFDDIHIGNPAAEINGNGYTGKSYVIFGKNTGFGPTLDVSSLNGTNGFSMQGTNEDDIFGIVGNGGDVNGDGINDIIIGAPGISPDGNMEAGQSYVIFGQSTGFSANLDPNMLDGNNGFILKGIATESYSGIAVDIAGDVNGDGIDDLIVGAFGASPEGREYAGESYVVFGRNTLGSIFGQAPTLPLTIAPNPTRDLIHISSDLFLQNPVVSIKLYDQIGRLYQVPQARQSDGNYQIDLQGLSSGIYLVHVIADGEIGLERVMKQ